MVLLDTVRLRNRCLALHPVDPSFPAPIRKRLRRSCHRHELPRHIPLLPNTHPWIPLLFKEPKRHHRLRAVLRRRQVRRGRVHVHARLVEQRAKHEIQLDDGVEMCVQDGALGQAAHNAPEFGALHPVLGEREHHARVHGAVLTDGERILVLGRPERALLFGADAFDDATGALGDGGEVLAEGVV